MKENRRAFGVSVSSDEVRQLILEIRLGQSAHGASERRRSAISFHWLVGLLLQSFPLPFKAQDLLAERVDLFRQPRTTRWRESLMPAPHDGPPAALLMVRRVRGLRRIVVESIDDRVRTEIADWRAGDMREQGSELDQRVSHGLSSRAESLRAVGRMQR